MPDDLRAQAESALRIVADRYNAALAELAEAEKSAETAAYQAKRQGLSQHDISRIMGPHWSASHNPQYPPVTDLQKPKEH